MAFNIKGTNINLTPELRDYVEKRLSHIERLLPDDGIVQLDAELAFNAGDAGPKYRAEFNLSSGKKLYRAEARGAVMHEAIDVAIHELNGEFSRGKGKELSRMRRGAVRMKEFLKGLRR